MKCSRLSRRGGSLELNANSRRKRVAWAYDAAKNATRSLFSRPSLARPLPKRSQSAQAALPGVIPFGSQRFTSLLARAAAEEDMATKIDREKPQVTEDQPSVKKLKINDDVVVTETVKTDDEAPVLENETATAAETTDEAPSAADDDNSSNSSSSKSKSDSAEDDDEAAENKDKDSESTEISKPAIEGSSFGGFTAFASTSTPSGSSSSGFGGFGGFAAFQSSSTASFSSFAAPTSSSGFGSTSTTASDFAEFGTTVGEKKADPVVPALTEAELANGEEGERILIEKRAKLFKLVENDYTEVGIGPVRILQAKEAAGTKASARVVMRRESYPHGPGTKLLLNARLSACLTCMKKTEKAMLLTIVETSDESADKITPSTYLFRFGGAEDMLAVHSVVQRYLPPTATVS